jgi:hypothetical protein
MKNAEKRTALLMVIDHLAAQLARLRADADPDPDPDIADEPSKAQAKPPFFGRAMTAKRGGVCFVCGGSIQQNTPIIYRGDDKTVSHGRCGSDDGRGRG